MKNHKEIQIALAPMAGITDRAFREICSDLGADITWSEMVSSEGLVRQKLENNKSLEIAKPFKREKNYWVQIFGNHPNSMAQAAKIIEKEIKPTGIDINLGCPAPKAQKAGYGACQIGNIPEVVRIIEEIKKEITLPLSLKTRVGLSDPKEILQFAPKLEKSGIDQLVVHARTLKEMFSGEPHWNIVKKLNEKLNIPIVFNGGITAPEKTKEYSKQSNCAKIMIGRAALGNPWIFNQSKDYLKNNHYKEPNSKEIKEIILKHVHLVEKYFGEKGFLVFRTHLAAYLKGFPKASFLRNEAVKVNNKSDVEKLIEKIN